MIPKPCRYLILILITHQIFASFMRHKYIVDVENGYLCPDNNQLEIPMRKYRVDRINRTHRAFTMDFSFANPIDHTVEVTIIMERWADGGWVNLPVFPYQTDPCRKIMGSHLKTAIELWSKFGKAMGLEHPEDCNIPAGNYTVNKYPIDITSDVPFWGGRFRSTLVLRRVSTKQKVFCAGSLLHFAELSN